MAPLPPGSRVVVSEFAENPLEAVEHKMSLVEMPAPDPAQLSSRDVIVAVEAAHVGVDLLMTSGQYQHVPQPPYTPGLEFAGEIVAAGAAVDPSLLGTQVLADGLLTGPRSLGQHRQYGGFASYAIAPARAAIPLPEGLSLDEGACLLAGYETAYHALVQRARLQAGEHLLVLGATGSTGLAAVQLGKLLGATVIGVGRTAAKLEVVHAHGADHVLLTGDDVSPPLRERLKALTGGRGVDVVYDAIGGTLSVEALRGAAFGARFVIVGWSSTPFVGRGERDPNTLPTNLILMKGIDVLGSPAAIAVHRDPALRTERLARILEWAREGRLRPLVSHTFAFADLAEALRAKWESRYPGNIIVHPEH